MGEGHRTRVNPKILYRNIPFHVREKIKAVRVILTTHLEFIVYVSTIEFRKKENTLILTNS